MNVRIKRLLSMLVVMAMIATMIVPVNFSTAKAEETPASQTEIAKGNTVKEKSAEVKDVFAAATGDPVTAICPVCYANGTNTEAVEWTAVTNSTWTAGTKVSASGHYYLAEDISDSTYVDNNYGYFRFEGTADAPVTACLNLNGKNATVSGGARFLEVRTATVSIVDTDPAAGAVVKGSSDNAADSTLYGTTLRARDSGAVINLYGGTYERIGDEETETDNAVAVVGIRGGAINMYDGATIQNGYGKNGGNLHINSANGATFNMYGGAILNGSATTGGNIYVNGSSSAGGTLNIYGGFVGGGTASGSGSHANIYINNKSGTYLAYFTMTGGTVVGGIYAAASGLAATISGTPKVVPHAVYNGVTYDAPVNGSGRYGMQNVAVTKANLSEGADLWMWSKMTESYAYCPECDAIQTWATISDATAVEEGKHYRLLDDVTKTYTTEESGSFLDATASFCLDLNGRAVTIDGRRFLNAGTADTTVNVYDFVGGAVVTGSNDNQSEDGLTIRTNSETATVNLYGGTYKSMPDSFTAKENKNAALVRMRGGGTINLYEGATIDGTGTTSSNAAVFMGGPSSVTAKSTFNIRGGKVIGTASNSKGGAFRVGYDDNTNNVAEVNMYSGTIIGSDANTGDAVHVLKGDVFNMTGGVVAGGEGSSGTLVYAAGTASISGGVIVGNLHTVAGSSVSLSGAPKVVTSYEDYTGADGLTVDTDTVVNVDGLTADAQIYVTADLGTVITAAHEGDDVSAAFVSAVADTRVVKNANNQYEIAMGYKVPEEGVFDPENCNGLAYCPICKGEPVEWTAVTNSWTAYEAMAGGHYYLAEDIDDDSKKASNYFYSTSDTVSACLNLNGKDVTISGGSRFLEVRASTFNVMDTVGGSLVKGSCDNGTQSSYYGTTIRLWDSTAVLNLYGGTYERIDDEETEADNAVAVVGIRGGAINMYDGATIQNGYGSSGGNLHINSANSSTFNMYGGAILNGSATTGGNIYVNGSSSAGGTLNIYGGFVGGGTASGSGSHANIYINNKNGTYLAYFTMTGGTVVGGINAAYNKLAATISGTPKVVPHAVYNGVTYDAPVNSSNGGRYGMQNVAVDKANLSEGADLWLWSKMTESYAYCPECDAIQTWTTISDAITVEEGKHYRLLDDITKNYTTEESGSFLDATASFCLDLNGRAVTIDGRRFLNAGTADTTVNVYDFVGGAVVTGSNDNQSEDGLTIRTNSETATVNLYGGTYKSMADSFTEKEYATAALVRMRGGGTINLYEGATIDGTGTTSSNAAVFMGGPSSVTAKSTFNIRGGKVIGTASNSKGGAFRVGYDDNAINVAEVNMYSGTIIGSAANTGDAVHVLKGDVFNMTGGVVAGGEGSSGTLVYAAGTASISGGVIVGNLHAVAGSSVSLSGAPKVVTSYEDYTGADGLTVDTDTVVNVDGLTADAVVYVSGDAGTVFTAAYTGDADLTKVFVLINASMMIQKNADNQYALVLPGAIIDGVMYVTAEEALAVYDIANGKMIALNGEVVIDEDIILDAANSTGLSLSGSGTVYGIDTSNDDFSGYKQITVTGDVTVASETVDAATGYRYMALKEGTDTYGFHRFETKLTHVTLRTTAAGLYYKASYQCDTLVRDRVQAYGVVLSTADMPGSDFLTDTANLYTIIEGQFAELYGDEVANTVKTTSGSVFGILKDINTTTRTADANTAALSTDIYGNSYIAVDMDGTGETQFFMADTVNGGKKRTDEGFSGTAWNLLEVVNSIDVSALTETQKTNLVNFLNAWVGQFDADGEAKWAAATSRIVA